DRCIVTLSPGRIGIRCIRSLPDTWARTLWPLSISTRNIALGSGSTTLPSTSIASSLLMTFAFHRRPGRTPKVDPAEMPKALRNTMALATWTRHHGQEGADTRERITHSVPNPQDVRHCLAGQADS